jgi:hypothetical protein
VPGTPFGTFMLEIATVARACQNRGVLRAAARLIDAATGHPDSAIGSNRYRGSTAFGYISRKRQRGYIRPIALHGPVLRADDDGQHPDLDDLA